VVLYDDDPGRSAAVPKRLLEGFAGYLQTDGYAGYNAAVTIKAEPAAYKAGPDK